MYTGQVVNDQFFLFHDEECVVSTPCNEFVGFDAPHEAVAYALLTYYFAEDGDALAEMKATELYQCFSCYLPTSLEFNFEDAFLTSTVELAIGSRASHIFEEYCGQQLYIQTLHVMLGEACLINPAGSDTSKPSVKQPRMA